MPDIVKQLGLIGKSLSHSFSKSYFANKFQQAGITDYRYDHYELKSIDEFLPLINKLPHLIGLNVTIPYKLEVIPLMDELSKEAEAIGAVNVIKVKAGKLTGFNSDYFGFQNSLVNWLPQHWQGKALILGTGGASQAVEAVLKDLQIPFQFVSRSPGADRVTYQQALDLQLIDSHQLIINTTPLGMHPQTDTYPDIDYDRISNEHFLYDLVYNPESTRFMQLGKKQGASIKNGLEMLELQAEKSWEIWTQPSVVK
jgi:shikimate dehydrogenase